VIVNRFEQKFFSSGLRRADIERAIGRSVAGYVPNHYGLVREAIDRGVPLDEIKPGNKITAQLKKFVLPQAGNKASRDAASAGKDLNPRGAGVNLGGERVRSATAP